MNFTLLRLPDVLARKGDSRSSTFIQIDDGTFMPPVKLGQRISAWPGYEVEAIIAARIAGWNEDEIRLLVTGLVNFRKVIPSLSSRNISQHISKLMASIRNDAS